MSDKKNYYYNRELSWMDFNARVLEEAQKKDNPLMERLRFLAITGSNLDEFFMVRVAGVKSQIASNYTKPDDSGMTPKELLSALDKKTHAFMEKQYSCLYRSILPVLKKQAEIEFRTPEKLTHEQRAFTDEYFHRVLFPVLTPLAVDSSRPFPMLANKSLNLAVRLSSKENKGEKCFAVVQVPSILPRFTELPADGDTRCFILLEDIITDYLEELFELHEIKAVCPFRITRNSDLTIDEEADDFMYEIEKSIKRRKRGRPVRLELLQHTDEDTRKFLIKALNINESGIYEVQGPIDLTFFSKFANIPGCEKLCFAPIRPTTPPGDFFGYTDIFKAIREGDRLVHHPYETFDCVVQFIAQAAEDENVLAIKQTLYRVSGNSPIIASLIKAAENGKQVTVLVELKARFDEENNIEWSRRLEEAGCNVIYGLDGYKVHSKLCLITRREELGVAYYTQIGTGNYNEKTARLYTDLCLMTADRDIGEEANAVFNALAKGETVHETRRLLVAPHCLQNKVLAMMDDEIRRARAGEEAYIGVKINSLTDKAIIDKLIEASCAGVKVDLVVRGICCLIAGVPEATENIRVVSIVGRFLEHSRIYIFGRGERAKVYIASADFMTRNTLRRVEVASPVMDADIRARILAMFDTMLRDNMQAREMDAQGQYHRLTPGESEPLSSQEYFFKQAYDAVSRVVISE